MNARGTTLVVGLITLGLGAGALFSPERVMGFLGYAFASQANSAATLGEVRATYGGVFTVMGVLTVLAAINPAANRGRILFAGLLWLGACAGRVIGAFVDGSPGLFGWLSAAFELAAGLVLVVGSQTASDSASVR
jgi:peptidoglycan/LPS O-acetylase OafA/YrhL